MNVPEVLDRAAELALTLGISNICKMEGCWEHQIDEQWWVALNGHRVTTRCSVNVEVPPFSAYFQFNDWPAGIVNAGGGCIAAGDLANENTLIAAIEVAIEKAKAISASPCVDSQSSKTKG